MSKQFDNTAYVEGVTFFNEGGSLKSVVERIMSEDGGGVSLDDDAKNMSFALGFADALIVRLRKL